MQSTEQKEEYWVEDKTGKILPQTSIRGKCMSKRAKISGFNRTIKRPNKSKSQQDRKS